MAELAARAGGGPETAGGALNRADPQSMRVYETGGASPTLTAQNGRGPQPPNVLAAGFKWHQGSESGSIGYGPGLSPTLTADYHNPAVMCMTDTQPHAMVDQEVCGALSATMQKDPPVLCMQNTTSNAAVDHDMCGTLTAGGGVPMIARNDGFVSDEDAPRMRGGGKGPLIQTDVSGSLATGNDQTLFEPVAFAANQRGEVRLQNGDGEITGAVPASQSGKQVNGIAQGYIVRRLTPRECERLQGMPDDHTKVPYRGKTAEECPDTPRYKAIGNSMAVPVMRWLGERIATVDASTCPRG